MTGNFSEMEEDPPAPEVGREYPLQRDEVKTVTGPKSGTNNTTSNTVTTKTGAGDEPKHYIGFVIGVLTVVILILVAAIVFIVFRNQRLKSGDDAVDVADYPTLRDDVKRAADEKVCSGFSFLSTLKRVPLGVIKLDLGLDLFDCVYKANGGTAFWGISFLNSSFKIVCGQVVLLR